MKEITLDNFTPTKNKILVEPIEGKQEKIFINKDENRARWYKVIKSNWKGVKAGDEIFVESYVGTTIVIKGKKYLIIRPYTVIAKRS